MHDRSPAVNNAEGTTTRDKEAKYEVLTISNICKRQVDIIENVRTLLCVPKAVVAVVLRQYHWSQDQVIKEWFEDQAAFREKAHLPPSSVVFADPQEDLNSKRKCNRCTDDDKRSAGCSHFYCDGCWQRYILAAVDDHHDHEACLSLQCPDKSCHVPVGWDLVQKVADVDAKKQYNWVMVRSYVSASGGRIKWCPRCSECAIEFLGGAGDSPNVVCNCKRPFCWRCEKEQHWPVPCEAMR